MKTIESTVKCLCVMGILTFAMSVPVWAADLPSKAKPANMSKNSMSSDKGVDSHKRAVLIRQAEFFKITPSSLKHIPGAEKIKSGREPWANANADRFQDIGGEGEMKDGQYLGSGAAIFRGKSKGDDTLKV